MRGLASLRAVGSVGLALLVGTAAFAFAASNTVPEGGAGDGSGAISGYVITNVAYALNATNPDSIDSVAFDVAPADADVSAPGTVRIQLASGGAWYSCAAGTGSSWSCATTSPQATVTAATALRVVAAE